MTYDEFIAAHEAEAERLGAEIISGIREVETDYESSDDNSDAGVEQIHNSKVLSGSLCSKTTKGALTTSFEEGRVRHDFVAWGSARDLENQRVAKETIIEMTIKSEGLTREQVIAQYPHLASPEEIEALFERPPFLH